MYDKNRVIATAEAELGYHEKASNASLDDKAANSGSNNWTKYARDLDAIGNFYNGGKNGYAWCDVFVDWCFVHTYGLEAALKLLCQPRKSAGAGCYYSAMYYKQRGQFHASGPQPGDQIFFTYSVGNVSHTGLVVAVSGSTVTTIEGNSSDGVNRRTYTLGTSTIHGYGRPDWSLGGDDEEAETVTAPAKAMDDATITQLAQEVIFGRWGNGADRVARLTAAGYDYALVQARVNEMLSAKISAVEPAVQQTYTVGKTAEETIANFCKEALGLNTAALCGVLANIESESGFRIGAIGDAGTSYGICQWHASRYASLKNWCANNGKDYTSLDGQLWYMKHELETTHAAVLTKMKSCADTEQGAEAAGYIWCSIFEVPANTIQTSKTRGELARCKYWPKYAGVAQAPAQETPVSETDTQAVAYTLELRELAQGAKSTAVRRVQAMLIDLGYKCGGRITNGRETPDGDFGPTTLAAVKAYQKANALTVTGKIDQATMKALLK